jgi:hypothetical protein
VREGGGGGRVANSKRERGKREKIEMVREEKNSTAGEKREVGN